MKKLRLILTLFVFCVSVLILSHCGSTIENEDTILSVSGYVMRQFGPDTVGARGIVVRLITLGLKDTTDAEGHYDIRATQSRLSALGYDLDTLEDSVIIKQDEETSFVLKVDRWIDTLPTVYLIQRDIRGSLDKNRFDVETADFGIAITVKNLDSSIMDSMVIDAEYMQGTGTYSCFAYFKNVEGGSQQEYSIYARAYDSLSHFIGQSRTFHFSAKAGDVELPMFNPFNAMPRPDAGNDTMVSIRDTIRLGGKARDSFGSIRLMEWDIGDQGVFTAFDSGLVVSAIAPSKPDSGYPCILRVMDSDSNVVFDTLRINVVLDAPVVVVSAPKNIVRMGDTMTLRAVVSNQFGSIVAWEWDIGNCGTFVPSVRDSLISFTAPLTPDNEYACIVRVTDDDDNKALDTVILSIVPPRSIGFASVELKDSSNSCILPIYLINDTSAVFGDQPVAGSHGAVRLDASSDTTLWFCHKDSSLWEYRNSAFVRNDVVVDGSSKKAFDVCVNPRKGKVFAAGEMMPKPGGGSLQNCYTYVNGQWLSWQGTMTRLEPSIGDTLLSCIGDGGQLYGLYSVGGWIPLNMQAIELSAGITYYAVSPDSMLYRWYNSSVWERMPVPQADGLIAGVETNLLDELLVCTRQNTVLFRNYDYKWVTVKNAGNIARVLDITLY